MTPDSSFVRFADTTHGTLINAPNGGGRVIFTINGRSWPSTERVHATVGDSLHWRIFSPSFDVHPMHLHGFYDRIDAFSSPGRAVRPGSSGRDGRHAAHDPVLDDVDDLVSRPAGQ